MIFGLSPVNLTTNPIWTLPTSFESSLRRPKKFAIYCPSYLISSSNSLLAQLKINSLPFVPLVLFILFVLLIISSLSMCPPIPMEYRLESRRSVWLLFLLIKKILPWFSKIKYGIICCQLGSDSTSERGKKRCFLTMIVRYFCKFWVSSPCQTFSKNKSLLLTTITFSSPFNILVFLTINLILYRNY